MSIDLTLDLVAEILSRALARLRLAAGAEVNLSTGCNEEINWVRCGRSSVLERLSDPAAKPSEAWRRLEHPKRPHKAC